MAQFINTFAPQQKAIGDAINYIMQRKQMAEDRRRFDIKLEQMRNERDRQDQQNAMRIKSEAKKAKIRYAQEMLKSAYERGDNQAVQKFGQHLSGLTGYPAPDQAAPQKMGMSEAELTQRALNGDKLSQAVLDRMAQRKKETAQAGKTDISVNTQESTKNMGSRVATKKYAEEIGARVNARFQQNEEAIRQNAQLDQVALALSQGARTGAGEDLLLNLRSLGQTFGLDTGDLSKEEMIRRVSNEMALRMRNPESGLGLTGNTSNKDLKFLKESVFGLERTEEGNRAIIKSMRLFNKLKQDVAKEQSRIISENGGIVPMDMDQKIMDYVDKYELFTPDERKEIEKFVAGSRGEPRASDLSNRFEIIRVE